LAVPASMVADIPHLREKTSKIGFIGRALAIFRVDEVIIYRDRSEEDQTGETNLIATLLSYMETPQYLRKYLFRIVPELRFAGALPPLRTPHHPLQNRVRDLKPGEYREGVITSVDEHAAHVDIGVNRTIAMPGFRLPVNTRVSVRITKTGKHPEATVANRGDIGTYWGYEVTVSKRPFVETVKSRSFNMVLATSRRGKDFGKVIFELKKRWEQSDRILVAFGAPTQGLYEIAEKEGIKLESIVDYVINTIPNQATETVRTEEAVYATLSILNVLAESHLRIGN